MPITEKQLIARIRQSSAKSARKGARLLKTPVPAGITGAQLVTGIGDDCAVLRVPCGFDTLVTTDFSLENVHFRREWHPADVVGHRCLTRGLSDIAAMGGEPVAAFLSLAVPADLPQRWVDSFLAGLNALADEYRIPLAGGDIAESPSGVLADIMVYGVVPEGKAILRSGAQAGDRIFVTGELGAASALLAQMYADPSRKFRPKSYPAHFYPRPQLKVARYLREKQIASAMIDISDGLSTELAHICEESEVGAVIHGSAVPRANVGRHEVDLAYALHGGDEYQLLFTSPQGKRVPSEIAGSPVTHIGYITDDREILLEEDNGYTTELEPQGWEHFSETAPGRRPKRKR